jgi:acetyl esterase
MPGYPMSPRTRVESLIARGATGLPPAALRTLGGAPIVRDGQTLEPEVQVLLRLMELDPRPNLEDQTPAEGRASIIEEARSVAGPPLPLSEVRETTVEGATGPLRARLYVPHECAGDAASGLLVFFHGGGWVVGDLDTHDAPCRLLARTAGVRVLAVDYRLAPEHRFPAAADDAYAAFAHVHGHAASYGADPERIAVGGDSAGGNVSAACALRAAREGGPAPAFQLLIYPVTDNSRQDRRSYELFGDGFFLTSAHMRWYREHYFGSDEATLSREPAASPLLAEDLAGVAPAHVITAGFDPLRDEGEEYAERLRDAGVPVTLRRHPGLIHGFLNAIGAGRASRDAVAEMGGVLRAGLAAPVRAGAI